MREARRELDFWTTQQADRVASAEAQSAIAEMQAQLENRLAT